MIRHRSFFDGTFSFFGRPHRLAWPRTLAFQAGNTGSNPVGDTIIPPRCLPSQAQRGPLPQAKQMALEEAGTSVESDTNVQNLNLTMEEIQTIADGVIRAEVLDKKRTLA